MQMKFIIRKNTAKGGQNYSQVKYNSLVHSHFLLQKSSAVWFKSIEFIGIVLFFISTYFGTAATLYVNVNSTNPVSPYISWETAANTIQDAVDAAQSGDTVLVTNGTYIAGGKAVYGLMTNRVAIDKSITVKSVNGPTVTFIVGAKSPDVYNGDGAIRCVYVGTNALLSGFTLTNGHTLMIGKTQEQDGGGLWCEKSGVVSNCVLIGNIASDSGGGAYQGTFYNCTLTGNSASYGGGVYECALYNCILTGNIANNGGGVDSSTIYDCFLTNNLSYENGGGAYNSTLYNCILTDNSAGFWGGGGASSCLLYNCKLTGNSTSGYGGGVGGGSTLYNCTLITNSGYYGGGAIGCRLYDCTLIGNSATVGSGICYSTIYNSTIAGNVSDYSGGGANESTLYNCTLTCNSSKNRGAGVMGSTLYNCIVYYNTATNEPNYDDISSFYYSCTTPLPEGEGNISTEPLFVNLTNGNLRLQSNSPCINAGNNDYVSLGVDLDGNPRISDGTVDMGAYEFQCLTNTPFYNWLIEYSLPTDGSADYIDSDGDGLNNWQEYQLGTNPLNKNTPGHFSLIQRLSNYKIHLNFLGEPNKQYKIDTSSNLINWIEFISISITNADGSSVIDETNTAPLRFYRGRMLPQ